MSSNDFLEELSPYQKELSLRIFNLSISKVLKNAYASFDEKTKEEMTIIFNSDNDDNKENFIKKSIPNFKEILEKETKMIENNIKSEIEKKI